MPNEAIDTEYRRANITFPGNSSTEYLFSASIGLCMPVLPSAVCCLPFCRLGDWGTEKEPQNKRAPTLPHPVGYFWLDLPLGYLAGGVHGKQYRVDPTTASSPTMH
jgi:hypothetical protein